MEMKVGEVAQCVLRPLLESGKIPQVEIDNLQKCDYCKRIFGLYVPMLIPYAGKKVYRYYVHELHIHGKPYLLTNDWYEDAQRHHLKPLLDYIARYKSAT